jgi:hypothetical protein
MIALLLAAAATQLSADQAVALCKPALARKAGGDIATIEVIDSHVARGRLAISGQLTAFTRMGPAPAGTARTHHVGRIDYSYSCEVSHGGVRKARVNLFKP